MRTLRLGERDREAEVVKKESADMKEVLWCSRGNKRGGGLCARR